MAEGSKTVEELCVEQKIDLRQLATKASLDESRVLAIAMCRWTPSPQERDAIAIALGTTRDQVIWGHKTPIQHIYGSGPG